MEPERILKANFIMSLILVSQSIDEDGKNVFKVIDGKNEKVKASDFHRSLQEDRDKGINHEIKVVNSKPTNFQFNVIYVRADGERVWIWLLDGEDISPEEAQSINDAAAGEAEIVEMESEN